MEKFEFASPYWFFLLVPLALLVAGHYFRRGRAAVLFSDVAIPRDLPKTAMQRVKLVVPWIMYLGLACLVVALARPQTLKLTQSFDVKTGVAIEMCIDRSGSMNALDMFVSRADGQQLYKQAVRQYPRIQTQDGQPITWADWTDEEIESGTRLAAVKKVFRQFVEGDEEQELPGRPNDLIGMLDFGGYVNENSASILTLDHANLIDQLEKVEITKPIVTDSGEVLNKDLLNEEHSTAIGDAVLIAVERLKGVKAKSKVIILLTDGRQTAGIEEPLDAARAAKAHGIKIYTIAVGRDDFVPIPTPDENGQSPVQRVDSQIARRYGAPLNSSLIIVTGPTQPSAGEFDEQTLREMASITNGKYFHAKNASALPEVYKMIDGLEKTENKAKGQTIVDKEEHFRHPLLAGLLCIGGFLLLVNTRFRELP